MNWLKYSGVWVGLVVNPYHWQLRWARDSNQVFENCLYLGPIWIRIVIDNGNY